MASRDNSNQSNPEYRGGGRGRGRGWGRGGRGNGRGQGSGRGRRGGRRGNFSNADPVHGDALQINSNLQQTPPKPRLTHFLSLPIGHHAELRGRMSAFTTALLRSDPAISGLDESIIISARRLHLTLGVMSLESLAGESSSTSNEAPGGSSARPRTLDSATSFLNELKPRILEILKGERLRVALENVDIMKPERGDPDRAHVMWAGPAHAGEDFERLNVLSQFIHKEFMEAGLVVDEKRPLKLHCTILNTTYRRPRNGNQRTPFSYTAVLESEAFRAIEQTNNIPQLDPPSATQPPRGQHPALVDLGECMVDEIQICEMGSWGPEGEYVCVGRCSLR